MSFNLLIGRLNEVTGLIPSQKQSDWKIPYREKRFWMKLQHIFGKPWKAKNLFLILTENTTV